MSVIWKSQEDSTIIEDGQQKNSFFRFNWNWRDFAKQFANVFTMRNIWEKPLFFRTDDEDLTYLIRWSEEIPAWHIQSSLESILDFNKKPTYLGKDWDYNVIMQRDEELYRSKNPIKNLQIIWWKLTFTIHEEWDDTLIRWDEKLWKWYYIGDIGEYQWKPIFVIYDSTLSVFRFNWTIMHWSKELWRGGGLIRRTNLWEPIYLIKDKNNDENMILKQWDKNLWTFKNIRSMIKTWWKLIYIAEEIEDNWGEVLMWWPNKLWKIIKKDEDYHIFELEGTDENICKLLGENWTGKSCIFRIRVIKKPKYYGDKNEDEYALFVNFKGKNYYNIDCTPIKYTE